MNSSNQQLISQEVSDFAEKDLDLAFGLLVLGEEHNSADDRIWGALIRGKYDQQTARRLHIRMFISFVESILFTLKSQAIETHPGKFSQAELALLGDKTYELSDKGDAVERPYFGQFEKNLKFTFRCYAKAFELDHSPDYSGAGWQAFQQAVRMRNRITHPKFAANMSISDDDQKTIDKARNWFVETYQALLSGAIKERESVLGKLEQGT
jgi:hypothetical protein